MATDNEGNEFAMARRLGVMYMIFDSKIWGAYKADEGWRDYNGSSPHTDHVHFSFSWEGALKQTSYWQAPVMESDAYVPSPDGGVDVGLSDSFEYSDGQSFAGDGEERPQEGCECNASTHANTDWLLAWTLLLFAGLFRKRGKKRA